MTAAVFLDRDNTIIHNDGDLGDPEQVRLIQGAASAISSLCGLGSRVIVVSNQGGVARGQFSEGDVEAVHERIRELVQQAANGARIDRFSYCPYHPEGKVAKYTREHYTRKPQPGMLTDAAEAFGLELGQCWMIGDQMRDIEAGAEAGTRTILLADPHEAPVPDSQTLGRSPGHPVRPNYLARNLVEAVRIIAQQRKPEIGEEPHRPRGSTGKRWDAAAIARIQEPRPDSSPAPATSEADAASGDLFETGSTSEPAGAGEAGAASGETAHPGAEPEADTKTKGEAAADADAETVAEAEAELEAVAEASSQPAPDSSTRHKASADSPDQGTPGVASSGASASPEFESSSRSHRGEPQARADEASLSEAASSAQSNATESNLPETQAAEPESEQRASEDMPESGSEARLLRSILQELRHQRGDAEGGSNLTVVAIVLQMIAVLCLIGGLLMGAQSDALFLRWLGAGLIVQLSTIAMLLFARQQP